ncbi:MAG TPA: DNA replication/repair protein RecF [Gammaproteobacteria bacterium]|nr:DNA replication/repair protein RecF [Gammaproteobacteria bacterium]
MTLTEFGLRDFRCFETAGLRLDSGVNIISGANGAGKTSLIEAIFCLGRGRSFRTAQLGSLQRHGTAGFQVFGLLETGDQSVRLGIERVGGEMRPRYNGQPADSMAVLAEALPLLLIDPHSHRLIEGGPAARRQFMDWGTFHVEQSFLAAWRRFRRALRQRNALLKHGASARSVNAWNAEFIEAGQAIDQARRAWLARFETALPAIRSRLFDDVEIEVRYRSGWAAGQSLEDAIARAADTDRERGISGVGPHRADLAVRWNGTPAQEQVSRGQQKLLAVAMLLAQAEVYRQARGHGCLLLVDDLAAELDSARLSRLLALLAQSSSQIVLTGIDASTLLRPPISEAKVFHVERGAVREVI